MRISFILCLLLATSIITQAQKYELPKPLNRTDEKTLVHEGYTCSFNTSRLTPTYVAWCLTRERVNGKVKRTNFFDVDPSVESRYQVRHSDYSGTRFDRGHMCPAADNQHSQKAMVECFYMTNMCPQRHALTSGAWTDLALMGTQLWKGVYLFWAHLRQETLSDHRQPQKLPYCCARPLL